MPQVTLAQIDSTISSHSMASVRSWLSNHGTSLSRATPRAEFAGAVHAAVIENNISLSDLFEGMIDIEEASGKRINLYRVGVTPRELASMKDQIISIVGALSTKRVPAPVHPSGTRRVYFIEDATSFRAKWAETHIVYKSDLNALTLTPIKETKIVVLVVTKSDGLVQIRYDRPGTKHPHSAGLRATTTAFYSHFKELTEALLGVTLNEVELRPSIQKVVNTTPRIVECRSTELSTDDNFNFKVTPKVRGKDVRDSKDFGAMGTHGSRVKVREVEDLTWFPDMSGQQITRQIKTHVDGRESFVRFEANYHEGEVVYVLSRLL